MTVVLLVFVAMLIQDTAEAMKIRFLGGPRRRRWLAGYCEATNDMGGALSVGVGGASVLKFGVSVETASILVALGAAAVLGTVAGDWLTERMYPTVPTPTERPPL